MAIDDDLTEDGKEARKRYLVQGPVEVFSNSVDVVEDNGILRFVFRSSRPEAGDRLGAPEVIVSRVAISRKLFEHYFAQAAKSFDP